MARDGGLAGAVTGSRFELTGRRVQAAATARRCGESHGVAVPLTQRGGVAVWTPSLPVDGLDGPIGDRGNLGVAVVQVPEEVVVDVGHVGEELHPAGDCARGE